MSVTDGSLATDGAQQTVRVIGTVTATPTGTQTVAGTVTANQGTAAATASAWPTKVTDGTSTANVAVPGPNLGAGLVTTTGTLVPSISLNALTAVGPGVVADFGSAKTSISMVHTTTAGISAGAVALEVSHDNSSWFRTATPVTLTASTTGNIAIGSNAFRYARAAITTTVVGGTVSATLMAA
jgi:hypothetical protein